MYIYCFVIFLLSLLYSSGFELGKFYYFEDTKTNLNQRNLYRGKLSTDDSWLSAEMLYDGNATKKKEVLLFKFGEEPCKPADGYKFRNYFNKANKDKIYDAHLVDWSNYEDNLVFSYINYKSRGADRGIRFMVSEPNYEDDFPFTITSSALSRNENIFGGNILDIDRINSYISIPDYYTMEIDEEEEDAYFISYLDSQKESKIVTSYSGFGNKVLYENKNSTKEIKNPEDVNVVYRGGDFDALVTFNGRYEQDIYYFCNILYNGGIKPELTPLNLFPKNSNYKLSDGSYAPLRKQIQPLFSYKGSYVSFLNQRTQLSSSGTSAASGKSNKIFDLYLFDTKKRSEFCEYQNTYTGEDEYTLVDENVVNVFNFELPSQTAMDHAWHPTKNIVFYIKRNNDKYEIKSYNADTKEHTILLKSRYSMGYISVSDSGNYLVFSFINLNKEFENCRGCNNKNVTARKIAVAELISN